MRCASTSRRIGSASLVGLVAFSLTGAASSLQPAWTAEVAGASELAVSRNLVVVAAGPFVKAFDLGSGQLAFSTPAGEEIRALSADASSIVVVARDGSALVVDPASGRPRFQQKGQGEYVGGAAGGDRIVLVRQDGAVEARAAEGGKELWRSLLSARPAAPPSVSDTHVLATDGSFVHALRREDGVRRWRFGVLAPGTPIPIARAVVLASTEPRFATSIDADTGALRWSYRLRTPAAQMPVASGEQLVVAAPLPGAEETGRTLLRALDSETGRLAWAAALPGEVSALAAANDLVFAATGATLHVVSRDGVLLSSTDLGTRIRRLAAGAGALVALGENGKLSGFPVASAKSAPPPLEAALKVLAADGPPRAELEALALRFARREIETALGEPLADAGVLVVSRKAAPDPLLGRPVLALELLAEDRYVCRMKLAADALEVVSWQNDRAAAESELVEVSAAQAELLTREKIALPDGAKLAHARVEVDSAGKAYLDVRWSAEKAEKPEMEMRLHPRTGALISLTALWKVPAEAARRWRKQLDAYRSPAARAPAPLAPEKRRLLGGEIAHYRLASQAHDAAFDGRWLWVTTNGGLYRVDPKTGEHRRLTTLHGLLDNEVTAVAVHDRVVWVASARGLTAIEKAGARRYPFDSATLRPDIRVRHIVAAPDAVWAATSAGVAELRSGVYRWFGVPHGLLSENVRALARGPGSILWAATDEGLARYDGRSWHVYRENDGLPQNDLVAVAVDKKGHVFAATAEKGVVRFDGKRWTLYRRQTAYGVPPERGPPSNRLLDFALDTPGGLWGVYEDGLTRFFRGKWLHLPLSGAVRGRKLARVLLAGRRMVCVAQGPGQGLVAFDGRDWQPEFVPPDRIEPPSAEWVVAAGDAAYAGSRAYGVAQFSAKGWERHNIDDGPLAGVLRATESAALDGAGNLYVGARGRYCVLRAGKWTCAGESDGAHAYTALAVDGQGRVWVGTGGGGIRRYEGARLREYGADDGLTSPHVRRLLAAPDGSVFALLDAGRGRSALVRRVRGQSRFQALGPTDGLSANPTAIGIDREGRVYVGTSAATLLRMEGARLERDARFDGLPVAPVTRIAFDRGNHPWVIHDRRRGVRHHDGKSWISFTRVNGLLSDEARDLAVDAAGGVWIATDEGLTRVLARE